MELTTEQAAVRDVVREFAEEELRPVAAECDAEQTFPEDVWDQLADLDLTGLTVPEEYGGYDADPMTYAIINEEMAYGMLSVATALSVHGLATSCIAEFGDDDLKEAWLPEMAQGRPIGAFALSEPDAGSNPAEMSTVARRDGDEFVIDGKKQWITNGKRSDVIILFAKTDRDDPGSITQFLVPKDEVEGLEVGKKEDKLGLRASDTTTLMFDGVRIPEEYQLTEEGKGLSAAFHILTGGRIAIGAQSVGLAQAAFDEALQYSQDREQFDQPISNFQAIRHKLADMQTKITAGRLLTREAARKKAQGDQQETAFAASQAKYFASEAAMDVTNEAVQIHGGYGYTTDFPVERFYRDAKILTIYEGTSEIQKKIIARHLLD
ncbi:acyl-CoA dehydrogenase family protein [Haloarchaeobius sp. HME9146]|uniref:acyl-CoA dehydrogenase family protein n=1 Tax=Haloarchaeobius sp. HME9146 TaxID=2978732 RepID=UPI0021BE5A49|nr:acyl-CoA dehydrogenase family protein [Haloarchaeobius sp. HME9146]MCT9097121.1 acyl-CoA dehydrogenase family protein [Haloarchaeobius sp. HME9146]